MNRFMRNIGFYLLIIFIAITFIDYFSVKNATTKQEMGYSAFLQQVDKGEVAKITMMNNIIEVKARGAEVIALAYRGNTDVVKNADEAIYVPKTETLFSASLILAIRSLRFMNIAASRNHP